MDNTSLQINKSRAYINFSIKHKLWSGIEHEDIRTWIRNFGDCSQEELSYIYKLLSHIIYFSENDIIALLKEGVYSCVSKERVLKQQKEAFFQLSQKALDNIHNEEVSKTVVIPLLVSNSPSESGNTIVRYLVNDGIIPEENVVFCQALPDYVKNHVVSRLLIVDDCIGSGDQLLEFWNTASLGTSRTPVTIGQFCSHNSISPFYLSLFGYKASVDDLQAHIPDLSIRCIRYLFDNNRVFDENSYIWESSMEREKALAFFIGKMKEVGIPISGYGGLDFAFIMHKTIPDWSLPMFWMKRVDWNLLIRRKNSNA